jgi:hypothetical protein
MSGGWDESMLKRMKFAYADPPYLGQCAKYDHYHPDGLCWDDVHTHYFLIQRLVKGYPDGWALSASSPSLREVLPKCPKDVCVGAWVKPFCAFKKGVRPCYAWEPIIFRGGRNPVNGFKHAPPERNGKQNTPKDFLIAEIESPAIRESITLKKGLTGAKPEAVCRWILELLNVQCGDEVVDLFPGTGVMGRIAASVTDEDLALR